MQAILQTRVGSRPRFVGPGQRLLTLCTLSLVVMHWYACGMWLIGERQAVAGRSTWVSQAMDGEYHRSSQRWPWPLWARYMYAFDRGLNTVLGGESRGGTHEELFWSVLGQLMGVAWLAYFTSEMVQLVTNMNQRDGTLRVLVARLGSAPARSLRLFSARLAAPGSSVLPE